VAERLGFLYIEDEIVAQAAAKGKIAASEVADEERRKSLVVRILETMAQGGELGGSIPQSGDEPNSDDIRALIRDTIEWTAARGKVVIVAHAASYAVTRGPHVLRVLVPASPETRVTRVREAESLDQPRAARAVKDSDAGRRDYLKRFYDVHEELPTHYDLVVNTDVLSPQQAADMVSQLASS